MLTGKRLLRLETESATAARRVPFGTNQEGRCTDGGQMILKGEGFWYRQYKALELTLSIWAIFQDPVNDHYEPFANISLRTAIIVSWGIWGGK